MNKNNRQELKFRTKQQVNNKFDGKSNTNNIFNMITKVNHIKLINKCLKGVK